MQDLHKKAFVGLLRLLITLAALLFFPAWTVHYWQAWIFLSVFSASVLAVTIYLMKKDPSLLQRRVNAGPAAEKQSRQKTIQFLASIAFIAVIIFPAIDYRFGWSRLPPSVAVAGDVLVALGLLIIFFVFRANTFTSGIIEVAPQQTVIFTGPYPLVRHPMYFGALVMLLGTPLALGSGWGLLTTIPITLVIVWRLLDEEAFLAKNLPGYSEYRNKVKYHLLPFVW